MSKSFKTSVVKSNTVFQQMLAVFLPHSVHLLCVYIWDDVIGPSLTYPVGYRWNWRVSTNSVSSTLPVITNTHSLRIIPAPTSASLLLQYVSRWLLFTASSSASLHLRYVSHSLLTPASSLPSLYLQYVSRWVLALASYLASLHLRYLSRRLLDPSLEHSLIARAVSFVLALVFGFVQFRNQVLHQSPPTH